MTTPQPNQLPEEVKRAILSLLRDSITVHEDDQIDVNRDFFDRLCTALTPYLAPRPPAPMDAEWATNARLVWRSNKFLREAFVETIAGLKAKLATRGYALFDKPQQSSAHLCWMLSELERRLDEFPADKTGRWLGYIQGCLACNGLLNVDEERDRTRPLFVKAYEMEKALRHAPADSASTQLAAMREHHNWTLESDSIVASCGCMTKTNEVKYHKPGCKYRLICERDESRTQLASAQAEVGRLTKELASKQALIDCFRVQEEGIATLRRELDEARGLLLSLSRSAEDGLGVIGGARLNFSPKLNPNGIALLDQGVQTIRSALDSARAKQGEGQA